MQNHNEERHDSSSQSGQNEPLVASTIQQRLDALEKERGEIITLLKSGEMSHAEAEQLLDDVEQMHYLVENQLIRELNGMYPSAPDGLRRKIGRFLFGR